MVKTGLLLTLIMVVSLLPAISLLVENDQKVYDISFNQVEQRARELSPQVRMIRKEIQRKQTESGSRLQKSNPYLDYSREFVKDDSFTETEQVFSLGKSFEMPWIYSQRRKEHRWYNESLQQEKEARIREFITRMKSGYVALSLMSQRLTIVDKVRVHVQKMADAAALRKEKGFITEFQKRVVEIALLNLESKTLSLSLEYHRMLNRWKIEMGFSDHSAIHLRDASSICYKPSSIPLTQLNDAETILRGMPQFISFESKGRSLEAGLKMEKMSIIPNINLNAGYKKVGSELSGYTFGLSFDLPLLNRNRNAVKRKTLDLEIHTGQFRLFKLRRQSRLIELIHAIKKYRPFLTRMHRLAAPDLEPVAAAFTEGNLSGADMISILQTYLEALDHYHQHLHAYFNSMFQLESLTGMQLIVF